MSSSTYLSLVNTLLEDHNEPTLTANNFDSARSVHRVAKNAINRSIDYIQTKEYTWPFNRRDGSQVTVAGQVHYDFPTDMKHPDMRSFYIEADDTLGVATRTLEVIAEQEWRNRYRRFDLDTEPGSGRRVPNYVFRTNDRWGISSAPDVAYTIRYQYWALWSRLVDQDDTPSIPTEWDHVIIQNANPFMYKFYNNVEDYQLSVDDAAQALKDMRQLLVPKDPQFWTGQLLVGGYYAQ